MDRVAFLENLRRRLGHQPGSPAPPLPRSWPQGRVEREWTGVFVEQLRDLDVTVETVATRPRALQAVERLLAHRGWRSVACAPCLRWSAIADVWVEEPREAAFGLAEADWAIAETGTVVLRNHGAFRREYSLLPPAIGLLVPESRIVPDIGDLLQSLPSDPHELPACVSLISGPSSTGDIASTRVIGVHGPGEVFVWVMGDDC